MISMKLSQHFVTFLKITFLGCFKQQHRVPVWWLVGVPTHYQVTHVLVQLGCDNGKPANRQDTSWAEQSHNLDFL